MHWLSRVVEPTVAFAMRKATDTFEAAALLWCAQKFAKT